MQRDRTYLVASHAGTHLTLPPGVSVFAGLLGARLFETRSEDAQSRFPVEVLAATAIDTNLNACGLVFEDDAGVCFVSVLTTLPRASSEGLIEVARVNQYFVCPGFFKNCYRNCRGLFTAALLCGRHPLPAHAPSFALE